MFTDGPATPLRVETLVRLVGDSTSRSLTRDSIKGLLQPEGIPGLTGSSSQAFDALAAARELGLVVDDGQGFHLVNARLRRPVDARRLVLEAVDDTVLANDIVEPYFGLFYSFLLSLNASAATARSPQDWATEFNRVVFGGERGRNPFNATKYTGLQRWYRYAGLGWNDPSGVFHCNPRGRLVRSLARIFEGGRVLECGAFMERLALVCPELDGGAIFLRADPSYALSRRQCTLGLSHALLETPHGRRDPPRVSSRCEWMEHCHRLTAT